MIDIGTMDHTPRYSWAVFSHDEVSLFKELGIYATPEHPYWTELLHKYSQYNNRFGNHMPDTLRKHLLRELASKVNLQERV